MLRNHKTKDSDILTESRVALELGIDHQEILRTSHGRRSIDVLQQLDPTKANWECMLAFFLFPVYD